MVIFQHKIHLLIFFRHGRALAKLGDYKEAMDMLQEAKKAEPNNTDIIYEIAQVIESALFRHYVKFDCNL